MERIMKVGRIIKKATRAGGAIATFCLLATAACGSDGDDATSESTPTDAPTTEVEEASVELTTTEPLETTPTTTAPTTTEPLETTPTSTAPTTTVTDTPSTQPPSDGVLVPFHFVDASFPAGGTCDDAIPGFEVAFTDESGERTIVAARFTTSFRLSTDDPNAVCAIETFEGAPALFVTARLDAPAAETYQSIETRYPFDNGAGNDTYTTVFEMVTSEQAQAGLYVELQQDMGPGALDPSEAVDLPFPVLE
jgi:hypothetical protein